jgi:hypothetical protein
MSSVKIACFALSSGMIVGSLSILQRFVDSPLVFYLLLPGSLASVLVTGGHGGTLLEERMGPIVGLIVNLIVYMSIMAMTFFAYSKWYSRDGS